jgi:hypothetical protein
MERTADRLWRFDGFVELCADRDDAPQLVRQFVALEDTMQHIPALFMFYKLSGKPLAAGPYAGKRGAMLQQQWNEAMLRHETARLHKEIELLNEKTARLHQETEALKRMNAEGHARIQQIIKRYDEDLSSYV